MRKLFSVFAALLLTTGAASAATQADFRACPQFFVGGKAPVSTVELGNTRALCFNSFAVLHSGVTKTPVYVAEKLSRDQLLAAKGEERTDKFFADARLPGAERAQLEDYRGSGFDRGHMAPAGDMPNADSMAQSFSLANMVPQAPVNNRKTWAGIENATRKFVMRSGGDVYVISGPVFMQPQPITIGPGHVRVPSHLFKLVYDSRSNRAWAYWLENNDEARISKPISYAELVKRTGIQYLPGVALQGDM